MNGLLPTVAIAGRPGAGKTTVAKLLEATAGLPRISVGGLLRDSLEREGIRVSSAADIGPVFLERHSAADLYELIVNATDGSSVPSVIDAVRLADTAGRLSSDGVQLWFVESPEPLRLERLRSRVNGASADEVRRILAQYHRYNADQELVKWRADVVVSNDAGFAELETFVRNRLDELRFPSNGR